MQRPDQATLEALARLSSNSDFGLVCQWVVSSRELSRDQAERAEDMREICRAQGRSQAYRDFLEHVKAAVTSVRRHQDAEKTGLIP